MLERKPLIFLILLAIVVVFSAAEALPVWPDAPSMFSDPPHSATINAGKNGYWEISASIKEDGTCSGEPCIKYQVFARRQGTASNTSGLGAIIVTRPYDNSCTIPFEVVWSPDDLKFEPDQKALPNTPGWEWDSITYPVEVGINSTDVTWGTACLKINRNYYCVDMLVPTCEIPECGDPPAAGVAASVQTCVNNYGKDEDPNDTAHYWFFRANDASGCIDPSEKFYICTGPCPRTFDDEYPPTNPNCTELPALQSAKHILASGLQGQKCDDEATNTTMGNSPFYHYETWSGGYYYEACYDYAIPGWTSVSACP